MMRQARFTLAEIRRTMRAAKAEGVKAILIFPDGKLEIDPLQSSQPADNEEKVRKSRDFRL